MVNLIRGLTVALAAQSAVGNGRLTYRPNGEFTPVNKTVQLCTDKPGNTPGARPSERCSVWHHANSNTDTNTKMLYVGANNGGSPKGEGISYDASGYDRPHNITAQPANYAPDEWSGNTRVPTEIIVGENTEKVFSNENPVIVVGGSSDQSIDNFSVSGGAKLAVSGLGANDCIGTKDTKNPYTFKTGSGDTVATIGFDSRISGGGNFDPGQMQEMIGGTTYAIRHETGERIPNCNEMSTPSKTPATSTPKPDATNTINPQGPLSTDSSNAAKSTLSSLAAAAVGGVILAAG